MTLTEYEATVAGAEHLDRLIPDWFTRVVLADIDQSTLTRCVVAQLHDNDWFSAPVEVRGAHPVLYGFATRGSETIFNGVALNAEWRDRVVERLVTEVEPEAATPEVDLNAVVKRHARALRKMYGQQTAGDYAFSGAVLKVLRDAGAPMNEKTGEVIDHFADELDKIYHEQTAGDYTFTGVVYEIMQDAGVR